MKRQFFKVACSYCEVRIFFYPTGILSEIESFLKRDSNYTVFSFSQIINLAEGTYALDYRFKELLISNLTFLFLLTYD